MPIRPADYLAEPITELVFADEVAAMDIVAKQLNVDVTRTYQFWESVVARLTGGTLTAHGCPWDIELPYLDQPIRIEVKYAQETWCSFQAGRRAIFKFAAPQGAHGAEKPVDVIVLLGIDELQQVHAWVVPAHVVKRCASITFTSPRFRTGSSRSRGIDSYRCPPTQVLPEVLRAYRDHHRETAAATRRAAIEAAGQLVIAAPGEPTEISVRGWTA